jgi:hypothetical protein
LASTVRVAPASAILSVAFVCLFYFIANHSRKGEHFAWLDGTSSWPSVGILFFTLLLALHFIVKSNYTLRENAAELSRHFRLTNTLRKPIQGPKPSAPKWRELLQLGWREVGYVPLIAPIAHVTNAAPTETPTENGRNPEQTIRLNALDINDLWGQYLSRGAFSRRGLRATPMAVLYFALLSVLMYLIGVPEPPPLRGLVPLVPLIVCTVFVFVFLLSFIVDATLLHKGFLEQLQRAVTYWPDETFRGFGYADNRNGKKYEIELAYFWDIMFIARRTVAVGELIYYPFLILFLLIVSRMPYFDNWVWLPAVVVALVVNFSVALYVAWQIPKTACAYRDKVLMELKRSKRQCLMRLRDAKSEVVDTMIDEVQSVHKGAFSYLWEQPAIRALLLPSSGVGIVTLLQYFTQ